MKQALALLFEGKDSENTATNNTVRTTSLVMGRGPLARAEPCGMGLRRDGAAGLGGRHVLEDTSHRFHLQLLPVHSLYLVEGGVGADDHEGGS